MPKEAKETKKATRGRPASAHVGRYPIRRHDEQEQAWRVAAATCGISLQDWIRSTLDAEAKRATHIPQLKREGVRRVG